MSTTLCEARDREETTRTRAFERALQAELDAKHREGIKAAREVEHTALLALEEAIIADAISAPHKVPPGTMMAEWKYPGRYGNRGERQSTGRLGIIEIVTRDSEHPDNVRYNRASLGEAVVRLLKKKDSTQSKAYVRGSAMRSEWLPVGQEPAKREEK